mgnify:CR=1 FL=1
MWKITWKQELEHLENLESQGLIEEAIAYKKEKGILELWETIEPHPDNIN